MTSRGKDWRKAVLGALRRFSERRRSRKVRRQEFIAEELSTIVGTTRTGGLTPAQTLSRVLQDLRDDGILQFLGRGTYLLLDEPLDIESEDLPDRAIDLAIAANKLRMGVVATESAEAVVRQRRGQERIRKLALLNYGSRCAVCDVSDLNLLVASRVCHTDAIL